MEVNFVFRTGVVGGGATSHEHPASHQRRQSALHVRGLRDPVGPHVLGVHHHGATPYFAFFLHFFIVPNQSMKPVRKTS